MRGGVARRPPRSSASCVYLYDDNHISLDGPTSLVLHRGRRRALRGATAGRCCASRTATRTSTRSTRRSRTASAQTDAAVDDRRADDDRLRLAEQGRARREAHGSPLGADEVAATKKALGWDRRSRSTMPPEALAHFRDGGRARREARRRSGSERFAGVREGASRTSPRSGALARKGELPAGWDADLPALEGGRALATREASGKAIERDRRRSARGSSAATPTSRCRPRRRSRAAATSTADRRRPQHPLRRPRARHGRDRQRHRLPRRRRARSSRRSSASPTTCGRRCASRR